MYTNFRRERKNCDRLLPAGNLHFEKASWNQLWSIQTSRWWRELNQSESLDKDECLCASTDVNQDSDKSFEDENDELTKYDFDDDPDMTEEEKKF